MPIPGVPQPDLLDVSDGLRLRKFDGRFDFAFPWYQDTETVRLVDGGPCPYDWDRLERMYSFLDGHGELYFIEVLEDGLWRPVGDVTFWKDDMPIVIGDSRYRGRGLGRKIIAALVERGRALGYSELKVGEIYDFNLPSQKCFESVGFQAWQKTERGCGYILRL